MNIIQVKTDSGDIVFVEVSEGVTILSGAVGGGSIADDEDVAAGMMQKIERVGSTIADVCRSIQRQVLASVGDSKPSELTLEYRYSIIFARMRTRIYLDSHPQFMEMA